MTLDINNNKTDALDIHLSAISELIAKYEESHTGKKVDVKIEKYKKDLNSEINKYLKGQSFDDKKLVSDAFNAGLNNYLDERYKQLTELVSQNPDPYRNPYKGDVYHTGPGRLSLELGIDKSYGNYRRTDDSLGEIVADFIENKFKKGEALTTTQIKYSSLGEGLGEDFIGSSKIPMEGQSEASLKHQLSKQARSAIAQYGNELLGFIQNFKKEYPKTAKELRIDLGIILEDKKVELEEASYLSQEFGDKIQVTTGKGNMNLTYGNSKVSIPLGK
jgi:hypothetical protein